jgi:hypothetical protein
MEIHRISFEEKEKLNGQACELFKIRNRDYWPSPVNSHKLVSFLEQNLGMTIAEYPYVVGVDIWQNCYDHLKVTSFFIERPVEEADTSAQTAEQQRALEIANANLDAARANEIRIAKKMPLKELGAFTSVENVKFRELRDTNNLPVRPVGTESRPLATVTFGIKAQARSNVALANPTLDRNGAEFSKLYAAELSRLRG